MLTFFVLFGLTAAWRIAASLGGPGGFADVFTQIDLAAHNYLTHREALLLPGRSIQLVLVGAVVFLTVRWVYRRQHPLLAGWARHALALLIVTSPLVWVNAPVLRPEAISGSLFLYIIVKLVFSERLTSREGYGLAALFGVVLAERLLFVFVAPVVAGGIFFLVQERKWVVSFRSLLLIVAVFVTLCPFILTDPLVVLKSFVGGILAKMQDKPMPTFFNEAFIGEFFNNPVNYLAVFLALVGIWVMLRERKPLYWLLAGNWLLFLFLVLRSAKIYGSHVLPAGVFTLVAVALGIRFLATKLPKSTLAASVTVVLLAAVGGYEVVSYQIKSHERTNIAQAYEWVKTLPGEPRLLLHPDLETYVPKSRECLLRELAQNQDTVKMVRKLGYLIGGKGGRVDAEPLPYVAYAFAFEDERLYETQYQLLLRYGERSRERKFDYDVYQDNTELASHSVQTEAAIQDFREGKYDYLVTERKLDDLEPVEVFSQDGRETVYGYASPSK